jgi:DUF971 family protein
MESGMQCPESLHNDAVRGVLEIAWPGGSRQHLSNALLRAQCRCAECSSLRLRSGAELSVPLQLRIVAIRPVGAYAAQFIFSDGHERGIYPWAFLKALGQAAPPAPDTAGN